MRILKTSGNENDRFSNVYTTCYAYLELGVIKSNPVRYCTTVECSKGSSSTLSVLSYFDLYSTY